MSKSIAQSQAGSVIPFKIEINPFSEDLLETSDTLVLIDELSSTLTPDLDSITVKDQSGNLITDYELSIEKDNSITYLRITLPDDRKLTLTYNASVSVAANQSVAIQNIAHWEGYEAVAATSITNTDYKYTTSVRVTGEPDLKIIKMDSENIKTRLSGAVFTMQEANYVDGNWELTGPVYEATTDENGTAYFSKEGTRWMKYNTIYQICETKAPAGYVLDTTPVYVALDNNQLTYPDGVEVVRNQVEFTYYATNSKGQIEVEKTFRTFDGTTLLNAPEGTYRFGLYEDTGTPSGQPLQILSIQYSQDGTAAYHLQQSVSGSTQQILQPRFINLDLDTRYAIYELAEDGSPILDTSQAAKINQSFYKVIYETAHTGLVPSSVSDVTEKVSMINEKAISYILPNTGVSVNIRYTLIGLLILIITGGGYLFLKKCKRLKL
jgi:LPXTG-motif cell wall-anchored protein